MSEITPEVLMAQAEAFHKVRLTPVHAARLAGLLEGFNNTMLKAAKRLRMESEPSSFEQVLLGHAETEAP